MRRAYLPVVLVIAMSLGPTVPTPAYGRDCYWQVDDGDWSNPTNWTDHDEETEDDEPTWDDWANIINGGTATISQLGKACLSLLVSQKSRVVMSGGSLWAGGECVVVGSFEQIGGSNRAGTLHLSDPNAIYDLSGGELAASSEDIQGTFTHTGGSNTASLLLQLDGTYNLKETGELSAYQERIDGTFLQSRGTNAVHLLDLNNIYGLSGGELAANHEYIDGIFSQSGGMHAVGWLHLNGSYGLGGGQLSTGKEDIDGTFTHTGGSNVANELELDGTYNLKETGELSAGYEYVGYSGTGTFTQSGGTNTISQCLKVGENAGGTGTYKLEEGELSASVEWIGSYGTGTFTQTGGTNTVSSGVVLGRHPDSSGTYELEDGELYASVLHIGVHGTGAFIQSGGTITAGFVNVDKTTGSFTQTGGTNTIANSLQVSRGATYNLIAGSLRSGAVDIWSPESNLTVAGDLDIGAQTPVSIGYLLKIGSGGKLQVGGALKMWPEGTFLPILDNTNRIGHVPVVVGGRASLDGTLWVQPPLFVPEVGESFRLMKYGEHEGKFATFRDACIDEDTEKFFDLDYGEEHLDAIVVKRHVIEGVPEYRWNYGCTPTCAGMVVGYWDNQTDFNGRDYTSLVAGQMEPDEDHGGRDGDNDPRHDSAPVDRPYRAGTRQPGTYTTVDKVIASERHVKDYWWGDDAGHDDPLGRCDGVAGDPVDPELPGHPDRWLRHGDDCIADYMLTSRDTRIWGGTARGDGSTHPFDMNLGMFRWSLYETPFIPTVDTWEPRDKGNQADYERLLEFIKRYIDQDIPVLVSWPRHTTVCYGYIDDGPDGDWDWLAIHDTWMNGTDTVNVNVAPCGETEWNVVYEAREDALDQEIEWWRLRVKQEPTGNPRETYAFVTAARVWYPEPYQRGSPVRGMLLDDPFSPLIPGAAPADFQYLVDPGSGNGTAEIVASPLDAGALLADDGDVNQVLRLHNTDPDSHVAIERMICPAELTKISFDYLFDTDGKLTLGLNGTVLAELVCPPSGPGSVGAGEFGCFKETFVLEELGVDLTDALTLRIELSNSADPLCYLDDLRVWSAVLTSVASGNWNAPQTWHEETITPTPDLATVIGTHTVNVAANGSAYSLLIEHPDGVVSVGAGCTLAVVRDVEVDGATLEIAGGGVLEVGRDLFVYPGSEYECELGSTADGLIAAAGNVFLHDETTLTLEAIDRLGDPGQKQRVIMTADGPGGISGSFTNQPHLGDYLGRGVFYLGSENVGNAYNVSVFQAGLGDVDGDGDVDLDDLSLLDDGWDPAADDKIWTDGDGDGDGDVDLDDLSLLDDAWAPTGYLLVDCGGEGPAPLGGPAGVPEPGTLVLLGMGLVGLLTFAWRKRRR